MNRGCDIERRNDSDAVVIIGTSVGIQTLLYSEGRTLGALNS